MKDIILALGGGIAGWIAVALLLFLIDPGARLRWKGVALTGGFVLAGVVGAIWLWGA
jgi:hypothetical protein